MDWETDIPAPPETTTAEPKPKPDRVYSDPIDLVPDFTLGGSPDHHVDEIISGDEDEDDVQIIEPPAVIHEADSDSDCCITKVDLTNVRDGDLDSECEEYERWIDARNGTWVTHRDGTREWDPNALTSIHTLGDGIPPHSREYQDSDEDPDWMDDE